MNVRVVNFRQKSFAREFIRSVQETGFAVITHHGISHELIKDTQEEWRNFFTSSSEQKKFWVNPFDSNMGYTKFGGEKALGASVSDLKEFFHWKPGSSIPLEVAPSTRRMFHLLEDIGNQLLRVIDDYEETNYSSACDASDNTLLRTLYYPSLVDLAVEPGAVRAAAHEDINFITLLVAASAPGLQVMDNSGNWVDVPHEENAIVVNIGDMLQLASQGKYKSTTHRVVNPENSTGDRISMPLFIHPHSNTMLAPGINAQTFLEQRLNAIYQTGYKK